VHGERTEREPITGLLGLGFRALCQGVIDKALGIPNYISANMSCEQGMSTQVVCTEL